VSDGGHVAQVKDWVEGRHNVAYTVAGVEIDGVGYEEVGEVIGEGGDVSVLGEWDRCLLLGDVEGGNGSGLIG